MLVGGHVPKAGGLEKAHARAVEWGCESMQIFNQSPRMWRTREPDPDEAERFRELMDDGPVGSVVIHAVYLINLGAKDPEVREKSIGSLAHALRMGDLIEADGVVVHPGSAVGEPHSEAMDRVAEGVIRVLGESERCPLVLENTAGAGQTIGRTFDELAGLLERVNGHERVGMCLDCCHLYASGFDIRTVEGLAQVVDDFDRIVGLDRLTCLHVNDSQVPLGSNRDRHANLPEGELGREGLSVFLSEPRFEGLPALLETEGPDRKGPGAGQIALAKELREQGLKARAA
jgi:deoxyribonuclease IV